MVRNAQKRSVVIRIFVGLVMVVAVAAPASAASNSGNLLAAAGVTFGAPTVEHLKMVTPDKAVPEVDRKSVV